MLLLQQYNSASSQLTAPAEDNDDGLMALPTLPGYGTQRSTVRNVVTFMDNRKDFVQSTTIVGTALQEKKLQKNIKNLINVMNSSKRFLFKLSKTPQYYIISRHIT